MLNQKSPHKYVSSPDQGSLFVINKMPQMVIYITNAEFYRQARPRQAVP